MKNRVTYEVLLQLLQHQPKATSSNTREIEWCYEGALIGVSRDQLGRIEIFLNCEEITPISGIVKANLEFEKWYRALGEPFFANRLLLPAVGHFDQVAAFLCTELIRNGGGTDPVGGFRRTEPVIELAIQRLTITDNELLGLCGEMLVLRGLIQSVDDFAVKGVVKSWCGFGETSRDFQLGNVGVEIKTTTGLSSVHHVAGINQVEVGHGVSGQDETDLQLVSLGLRWFEGDNFDAFNLPAVVDDILLRVRETQGDESRNIEEDLKSKISQYGSSNDLGYQHDSMATERHFSRPFQIMFVRCYDMLDDRILVLRTDDLVARPNVRPESVRFSISLPDQVHGDLNPVLGLTTTARHILALRSLLP